MAATVALCWQALTLTVCESVCISMWHFAYSLHSVCNTCVSTLRVSALTFITASRVCRRFEWPERAVSVCVCVCVFVCVLCVRDIRSQLFSRLGLGLQL